MAPHSSPLIPTSWYWHPTSHIVLSRGWSVWLIAHGKRYATSEISIKYCSFYLGHSLASSINFFLLDLTLWGKQVAILWLVLRWGSRGWQLNLKPTTRKELILATDHLRELERRFSSQLSFEITNPDWQLDCNFVRDLEPEPLSYAASRLLILQHYVR